MPTAPTEVPALIVGGWYRGDRDAGNYGRIWSSATTPSSQRLPTLTPTHRGQSTSQLDVRREEWDSEFQLSAFLHRGTEQFRRRPRSLRGGSTERQHATRIDPPRPPAVPGDPPQKRNRLTFAPPAKALS